MIINTRFFNHKLIIVSLTTALFILGCVSLVSLYSLKIRQNYLKEEKKLIENELSQAISSLNEIRKDNKAISNKLQEKEFELDSLKAVKTNFKLY